MFMILYKSLEDSIVKFTYVSDIYTHQRVPISYNTKNTVCHMPLYILCLIIDMVMFLLTI